MYDYARDRAFGVVAVGVCACRGGIQILLPLKTHVAPQRDRADGVLRRADALGKDLFSKAHAKDVHPHAQRPRRQKMPQLVEKDEEADRQHRDHKIYRVKIKSDRQDRER